MWNKQNPFPSNREKSNKSKSVAFWLCLIFGPLGLHRLYVGKMVSGLVMFVPSLISGIFFYNKFNQLSDTLNAALSGQNQDEQLNNLSSILNSPAAQSSSSWESLLSWITFALLIWTLIDLISISSGKFTDNEGRTL